VVTSAATKWAKELRTIVKAKIALNARFQKGGEVRELRLDREGLIQDLRCNIGTASAQSTSDFNEEFVQIEGISLRPSTSATTGRTTRSG
jgi:hypothetical protein